MIKSDLFINYLFVKCYLVCKYVYLIKYEKKVFVYGKKDIILWNWEKVMFLNIVYFGNKVFVFIIKLWYVYK